METKKTKYRIEDVLSMDQLKLLDGRSVLVGGTAIAIMLGPEIVSHPSYMRSSDIDVVMSGPDANRLSKRLKCELIEKNILDEHLVKLSSGIGGGRKVKDNKSLFTLLRLADHDMDIFTPSTGVGPITVDNRVFENAVKYKVDGREFNVAHPAYIIATTLNPLAAMQNSRVSRSFLFISKYISENGEDAFFKGVLEPAIAYMKEGSYNVSKVVEEVYSGTYKRGDQNWAKLSHMLRSNKDNCNLRYDAYLTKKMPDTFNTNKGAIAKFVTKVGVGTKESNMRIVSKVSKSLKDA